MAFLSADALELDVWFTESLFALLKSCLAEFDSPVDADMPNKLAVGPWEDTLYRNFRGLLGLTQGR